MDTMVDWAGAVRERAAAERVEVEAGEGAPKAAVATAEVATETGTGRSTSRCSSCRTSCSQLLRASSSLQTCAR